MRRRDDRRLLIALVIALLLHIPLAWVGEQWLVGPSVDKAPSRSIIIDLSEPEPEPEPLPEEEPRPQIPLAGQVVELPEPEVIEEPEEAEYLAAHSRKVEEEMRSERFKINPEELSPVYSEEAPQQRQEDLQQAQEDRKTTTSPETGIEPLPEAEFALYPDRFSRWAFMDQPPGPRADRASTRAAQDRQGAPQNDYLNEKVGEATLLNSREFLYADYFNKIRRLVNFWWSQNLDNIGPRDIDQPLRRPTYRTLVLPTLDAEGHLIDVKLIKGCGVRAFDKAVLDAWRAASPFPEPPEGLVVNGRAELIRFDFILELGRGQSQYTAIDPRADVRFPGIAWPR